MRFLCQFFVLILISITAVIADEVKPITPEEAAKKVNEKVDVQFEVKSVGGRNNHYLNSETDFMDAKNFTIFIDKEYLDKFKKAGIEDPSKHYNGKVIRVTGTVILEKKKPWIKVQEPDQIKIVEKEKK